MAYVLGEKSLAKLKGVHPRLVQVVKRAIVLTKQDFAVTDGLRTAEQQRVLVQKGASETMLSKHLKQRDGWGHAVDLVPWINGGPRWEWEPIWNIAHAIDQASTELNVNLVWGAVWDRNMMSYGGSKEELQKAVEEYKARRRALGKKRIFLDGPHYQLAGI